MSIRWAAVLWLIAIGCANDRPPPKPAPGLSDEERGWLKLGTPVSATKATESPAEARSLVTKTPQGMQVDSTDLSRDTIQNQVNGKLGAIQYCYEQQLAKDTTLEGSVRMVWDVMPDGTVVSPHAEDVTLPSPAVVACVEKVVRTMKFPVRASDRGAIRVSYPFNFTSQGNTEKRPRTR